MHEEIWELRSALSKIWEYEDYLKDIDRDAWKEFQWISNDLSEAIESAEEQLGWAVSEARELSIQLENSEDELYDANNTILELRESREDMIETLKKWMEEF